MSERASAKLGAGDRNQPSCKRDGRSDILDRAKQRPRSLDPQERFIEWQLVELWIEERHRRVS